MLRDEVYHVAMRLSRFNGLYLTLFENCIISESNTIPTAMVCKKHNDSTIYFLINPGFWRGLSENKKEFVVAHELLHIISNHLTRGKNADQNKMNIAMDICVNHATHRMGIDRTGYDWESYYWIETAKFKGPVEQNKSAEYYYDKLEDVQEKELADGHEEWTASPEELAKILANANTGDVQKTLEKLVGSESATKVMNLLKEREIERRWENLNMIAKLEEQEPNRTFLHPNYAVQSDDFILPGKRRRRTEKQKRKLAVFWDVSQSCGHLKDKFARVASSFNPRKFDVSLFTFNTKVTPVRDMAAIEVGGGTSFSCINDYVNSMPSYPDNIIVITDGEGDVVNPNRPQRWKWYLAGSKSTSCIPTCPKYDLDTMQEL